MKLNKHNLLDIPSAANLVKPAKNAFELPEKVLQFGTGILLRGLPDLIIHQANNKGLFNGRIVVVKSTSTGDTDSFNLQDGLYTVCIRGVEKEENHIVSSVSRVLSASNEWDSVLECAGNPELQIVISNTTELGIVLVQDNIHHAPPVSFPGKLVAFLYQRFKYFNGDSDKGLVIVPTELITNNGDVLLSIVLELAHQNNLETSFIDWIENANFFCNSLVDRIVPGKLKLQDQQKIESELRYADELMIVSEAYSLWAIESRNEKVRQILSFADDDNGVIIAPDINKFREIKLRLLNGSHTFSCGLAHLAGFSTVNEAMDDADFSEYIYQLMHSEIVPIIARGDISESEAKSFADKVLDRYRNNYIEHKWLSITTQYSSKMLTRNVDMIRNFANIFGFVPPYIALGFAAHILFMKGTLAADGIYYGLANGTAYPITDTNAAFYAAAWQDASEQRVVEKILSNKTLWQANLFDFPGAAESIGYWLNVLINEGAASALKSAGKQKKELIK